MRQRSPYVLVPGLYGQIERWLLANHRVDSEVIAASFPTRSGRSWSVAPRLPASA
jgi:hypothetical protein